MLFRSGGATVISAFLASGLVDLVVVTIAPVFVGEGISMIRPNVSTWLWRAGERAGADFAPSHTSQITIPSFRHVSSRLFGQDAVVVLRPE